MLLILALLLPQPVLARIEHTWNTGILWIYVFGDDNGDTGDDDIVIDCEEYGGVTINGEWLPDGDGNSIHCSDIKHIVVMGGSGDNIMDIRVFEAEKASRTNPKIHLPNVNKLSMNRASNIRFTTVHFSQVTKVRPPRFSETSEVWDGMSTQEFRLRVASLLSVGGSIVSSLPRILIFSIREKVPQHLQKTNRPPRFQKTSEVKGT